MDPSSLHQSSDEFTCAKWTSKVKRDGTFIRLDRDRKLQESAQKDLADRLPNIVEAREKIEHAQRGMEPLAHRSNRGSGGGCSGNRCCCVAPHAGSPG
jgi:hypothetical protein